MNNKKKLFVISTEVKHSEIHCFLEFLPFLLHKVTTSSKICRSIVVSSGWQCVSRTELGSSSRELPAASQLELEL